jgi:hypothetical protein
MSVSATQAVLTEFCTKHGLTIALGLINAINAPEHIQSFIGFLRLIPTVPAAELDALDRDLQLRVRDIEIAELKTEIERLKAANAALQARVSQLLGRPAPSVAAPRAPGRRPSVTPVRLAPGAAPQPRKRQRKAPADGAQRKRARPVPAVAAFPRSATPDGTGSGGEEGEPSAPEPHAADKGKEGTALVNTDAQSL